MRIFDPHIHMTSRTTDDYEAMYAAGVRGLVEPSFWLGQPRTSVDSFVDYFDGLVGWERFRAAQFGIAHHSTIALNPKEANDPRCIAVLDLLPRYLAKDGVVAVGEVGFDSMTADEEKAFVRQLELAAEYELPALVHTPHRDKRPARGAPWNWSRRRRPPNRVLVDHLNEMTVGRGRHGLLDGFLDLPRHQDGRAPDGRILAERGLDRMLVNSAADWGRSDPLTRPGPARRCSPPASTTTTSTGCCGATRWSSTARADGCCWTCPPEPTFAGNSLLRGERPSRLNVRFRHPDGTVVHLATAATCTRRGRRRAPRPAADLRRRCAGPARCRPDRVGLWLPAPAAAQLATDPAGLDRLRVALDRHGLEVVTLNAFPYEGFHAPVVKRDVYPPDWSRRPPGLHRRLRAGPRRAAARRRHTRQHLDAAARLAHPVVHRPQRQRASCWSGWPTAWPDRRRHGRLVRVGFEPEPGCVVETTRTRWRGWAASTPTTSASASTPATSPPLRGRRRGARPAARAGLPVVKVQPRRRCTPTPSDPATREALAAYAEDRFLHQTRERGTNRRLGRDDLPEALDGSRRCPASRRGGFTSTSRCTRTRRRRCGAPAATSRRRWERCSAGTRR